MSREKRIKAMRAAYTKLLRYSKAAGFTPVELDDGYDTMTFPKNVTHAVFFDECTATDSCSVTFTHVDGEVTAYLINVNEPYEIVCDYGYPVDNPALGELFGTQVSNRLYDEG